MDRVRRFWASVRPRTLRGAVAATIAIVAGAAAVSVALTVGAAMAWSPYLAYDVDRESNARAWAGYELSFAGTETCARCHEPQAETVAVKPHRNVACESCHAPLGDHVADAEASPAVLTVALEEPEHEACIACHADAAGRPADLPVIDTWQHYKPVCLECHDPHTSVAMRPPEVMHPLANLPECIVCHGPEGFKARNIRHPDQETDDVSCLECHARGRGPGKDETE